MIWVKRVAVVGGYVVVTKLMEMFSFMIPY